MRALPLTICALWFVSAACTGTSSSISVTAPTVAKCQVSVENAPSDAAPADGMTGSVAINTTRDCTWTASSNAAWLAITSAATGQGSETLTYKVSANAEPVARRGTLEVNNTQVAVAQEAAPCRYSVSPTNATVSAGGGDLAFTMETLTGCAWTAASQAAWITLPPTAAAGNRSGTLTLTVARNTAAAARSGIVTIGPQTVTIQQAAADPEQTPVPGPVPGPTPSPTPVPTPTPTPTPVPCAFDISPTSASVGSDAATGSIQVTAGAGCAWTASENTSWVTITSGTSGSGNGRVDYRVAANSGGARNATLTVAGKTFALSQAAAPPPACTFSISPTTQGFTDPGGPGSIAVTASVNTCAWTAATSAPWIVLGANSGTGNGSVGFTVAANTALTARTGTIAVAGKTFTVSQQGAPPPPPCTFSISPTTQDNVADTGGSSSVAVTASAITCAWTATSNAPWLTVTSGASGTGNGPVGIAIAANAAAAPRSGTVTIAGQTFTVSQAAPVPCTFSISPTTLDNVSDTGGSGLVAVTASTGTCTWTATSNAPWLTFTGGAAGTGNGAVSIAIAANTTVARSGTMTIAGQTFTVSQAAPPPPPPPPPPCTFSLSPTSQEFVAAGGSGSVTVTASAPTCAWSANANIDWLVIVSGASGTGSGTVSFNVATTTEGGDRTGTLTIAGQTFTVTQRHP